MNKLDCVRAEEMIIEDLDEGLSPKRLALLEDHLAGCNVCRRSRAATADVLSLVASDIPNEPSEEYWRLYRQSLQTLLAEKDLPAPWRSSWKLVMVTAGVALLVLGLWRGAPLLDRVSPRAEIPKEIMTDLEHLYGPVRGEIPEPVLTNDQLCALSGIGSNGREAIIGWFEVEDEPDNLLL